MTMFPSLNELDKALEFNTPESFLLFSFHKIDKLLEKLENQYENQKPLTLTDLCKLYQTVLQSYLKKDPSMILPREIKYLPYLFFYGQKEDYFANDKNICVYMIDLIKKRRNVRRSLSTVIHSYLVLYSPNLSGIPIIRNFILDGLNNIDHCGKRLKKWKDMAFVFHEDGPAKFIEVMSHQSDLGNFFAMLDIEPQIRWGGFMKAATRLFYQATNISNEIKFLALDSLFDAGSSYNKSPFLDVVPDSANALIPWATTPERRSKLRQFYLYHLQDQRTSGAVSWEKVLPENKKIFIQWLAEFDLGIFFTIIRRTSLDPGWEYRMKFWEAYLPYFKSTWIVLGSDARKLTERMNRADNKESRLHYAELKQASKDQSIFIFEMGGYIFLEWSHAGMLRIWKKQDSPVQIGKNEYLASDCRQGKTSFEKRHYPYENYSWQEEVRHWLQDSCGISPQKSYRL